MTTRRIAGSAVALAACLFATASVAIAETIELPVTRGTEPACPIVLLDQPGKPSPLGMEKAADEIRAVVNRWAGAELKVEHRSASDGVPAGPAIVLATLDALNTAKWHSDATADLLRRVSMTDEQGFACFTASDQGVKTSPRVFVVSRSARGVFNGAVYLREFAIDGPKSGLAISLPAEGSLRSPQMSARGTYALGIYGVGPQYTLEMWKHYFDAFAEDGMDRVYFWTSGFFPSKLFPQTFNRDGAAGTKIGDESSLRALVDHAHAMGLKFYIGSGVFAWTNAAYLAQDHPEAGAKGAGGLCPSNPLVRERTLESLVEMYDALPDADGMFLEVRDEHGECQCPICQKPVDDLGSKQYGQAEITFLRELADRVWQKHPQAHFSWNIGYAEHQHDVAYYRAIREMNDPRFEWLECRGSWDLPGPTGKRLPLAYFTPRAIHWDLLCDVPLAKLADVCRKSASEGLAGYVAAFNPGFLTADYYNQDVPYPTDLVPFNVTRFAYRELTWEPSLSPEQLREHIQRRFFGSDVAGRELSADLWTLREWIMTNATLLNKYAQDWVSYDTHVVPKRVLSTQVEFAKTSADARALLKTVERLQSVRDDDMALLSRIESHLGAAESQANPKALESIRLMRRAIDDTRKQFKLAVPDPAALDVWRERLAVIAR